MGRGAVGKEVELLLLDPVLHLAASAVDLFIDGARLGLLRGQRGNDESRVLSVQSDLGLADDAPLSAPAVERPVVPFSEDALRLSRLRAELFRLPQRLLARV